MQQQIQRAPQEWHNMDIRSIKQSALLTLIEESTLLSYGQKLTLLEEFPTFTEEQMDALADMLSAEQEFIEEYGEDFKKGIESVLGKIVTPDEHAVYVGVGKPSSDTDVKTQ